MDGYQLTASIIQSIVSLAWPAAVVASVWLFREELKRLLPRIRVKHKDWEVSFRLDEAAKEAAAIPQPQQADLGEPTPEERNKFERIAEISPRAAILEARTDIEEAVRSLAKATNLLTPRVQSTLGLTRLLRSRGRLDDRTSALLDDLRVVGNQAAHSPDVEFTIEEARRYRALADAAIKSMATLETLADVFIQKEK